MGQIGHFHIKFTHGCVRCIIHIFGMLILPVVLNKTQGTVFKSDKYFQRYSLLNLALQEGAWCNEGMQVLQLPNATWATC